MVTCPSLENPADVASRGILPQQLLEHKLWWTGPSWLSNQSFSSNINTSHSTCLTSATVCTSVSTHHSTSQPLLESNDLTCNVNLTQSTPEFLLKFSSYPKLIRVTSWMLRFCHNIRFPADLKRGNLHVQELRTALTVIVKIIQGIEFATEFQCLKHCKPLPAKSKLHPLNVFLDQDEIIRVGGRLLQATELPVDKKHPMLLPAKHHFTTILVNHLHHIHLHAGAHLVLSFLRQQFWVINARNVIRKILHSCVTCFRMRATPCSQLMGNLPPERVTLIRPFKTVGVDFSGAFITKPNLPRSQTKIKSYICLFICLATKSVHLELVSELTTSCFLACLRRFISRRGIPTDIFSDNATNFRGAASHLHQFHSICKDSEIQHFCNDHLVQWHFIPAYAPNFGGLWEASIKLTKTHLLRVCKSAILNFEQLSTLLCQIEAVINSRPLFPLSTDPHDYQVLTPGHFLIGAPLLELPNPSPRSPSLPFSAKWDLIQKMRLHFWQRWNLEYLHHLQPRSKWAVSHPNLQVGQLVLIKDPNLPPLSWMTGRVSKVFPGSDGYVRVVSLTTRKGEISRSISKLAVFPDVHTPQIHSSSPLPGPEDVASQQEASTS